MLIIISEKNNTAIDWSSVEGLSLEEGEYNRELVIRTKSGSTCRVINPTEEGGSELNFEVIVHAWLSGYTAWRVNEGRGNSPVPQMPPKAPSPLMHCHFCNEELSFGECTSGHCMSKRVINR